MDSVVSSLLLKEGFKRLAKGEQTISTCSLKQLLKANLLSLSHPFVVATLDGVKDKTQFSYPEVQDIYRKIKDNVSDASTEEHLQLFRQYDRNHDGFISKEDLRLCLREDEYYEDDEMDVVIDLVMKFGDLNADGRLNYIEFLNCVKDAVM